MAKVAWDTVCLPKNEGGLGLRNLHMWNKTLCLKLIWFLFAKGDSLWVNWINTHRVKNGFIWNLNEQLHSSWTWKALLSLRPLTARFIRSKVGNGKLTSFWFDHWLPIGPLVHLFANNGPRQTGIPLNASIAHACSSSGWKLRPARSKEAEDLQVLLTTLPLPSRSPDADTFFWHILGSDFNKFSTKKTWESLRPRRDLQPWTANVWFKGAIPRHAFHMWITHQDRLPTRSRLLKWGMQIQNACCLCGRFEEDRDHLFLKCEVSEELWNLAIERLGYRPFLFHTWTAFTTWLCTSDHISPKPLRRLVSQAVIYAIWSERNARLHVSTSTTPQQIFRNLDRLIRDTILARKSHKHLGGLMQNWLTHE